MKAFATLHACRRGRGAPERRSFLADSGGKAREDRDAAHMIER